MLGLGNLDHIPYILIASGEELTVHWITMSCLRNKGQSRAVEGSFPINHESQNAKQVINWTVESHDKSNIFVIRGSFIFVVYVLVIILQNVQIIDASFLALWTSNIVYSN